MGSFLLVRALSHGIFNLDAGTLKLKHLTKLNQRLNGLSLSDSGSMSSVATVVSLLHVSVKAPISSGIVIRQSTGPVAMGADGRLT